MFVNIKETLIGNKYSRLTLSRTSRDLIKMFELSVVRDNQIVTS